MRLRLGRALLEGDGQRAWYNSMQARAIAKALRVSTPVTSGAWPVRTASTKPAKLSVSMATVDRVLSGRTVVRESTAARAQAAAQALGYHLPNR